MFLVEVVRVDGYCGHLFRGQVFVIAASVIPSCQSASIRVTFSFMLVHIRLLVA